MMEQFMRAAFCPNVGKKQRAHCELFNPPNSGYIVFIEQIWISGSSGFTILGKGSPMLDDASFPESRGLPIYDGAKRPYSSAHARTKLTTAPDEVIQGGQWLNQENSTDIFVFKPCNFIMLGENTGCMIRSNYDGQKLFTSFLWHEKVK